MWQACIDWLKCQIKTVSIQIENIDEDIIHIDHVLESLKKPSTVKTDMQ